MAAPAPRRLPVVSQAQDSLGDEIRAAVSHDVIFAVVGHAGSGASRAAYALREGLKLIKFDVELIKVSSLISSVAKSFDAERWQDSPSDKLLRTRTLQEAGNWLRERFSSSFTAALAIQEMHRLRKSRSDRTSPIAFILDSLKNPDEVDALRKVYGRSFYLVGVVCGEEVREARLRMKYKSSSPEEISELMRRDESQEEKYGQQVRKTVHVADFFLNNQADMRSSVPDPVDESLSRFLQIVCGKEVVRPTQDEKGMYAAWGASLRSACMSRQVGASILDAHGELISTGTNDVPKAGGGLYEDSSQSEDKRCYAYAKPDENEPHGFCRSDKAKESILTQVIEELRSANLLVADANSKDVVSALQRTPLSDLIEFSRAVHAEMDALIALARTGSNGVRGATLYCTTFPCHSCARHIIASGISEVVYYEPYPKSRALVLHDDSLAHHMPDVDAGTRSPLVHFRLFTGVAPRRFAALFEKRRELKKDGRLIIPDVSNTHTDPIFTKSHLQLEEAIVERVKKQTSTEAPEVTP